MPRILLAPVGADNPEAPPESPGIVTALVLEAALRAAGMRPDVFFYFNSSWPVARESLLSRIREKRYDVLGLSFMSYNRIEAYDLLRELGRAAPDCRIIVGGVHASFLPEQLLREFPNIAAVAIGEGEEALVEFCRAPDRPEAIAGIAWRDAAGTVRVNPRTEKRGIDLERQPALDYRLLRGLSGMVPVQTSRGCVGRCVFCSWRMMETTVKTKPTDRIVEEWRQIREIFGPDRHITIVDALFNVSLGHVKTMCRALIETGLTTNPWDAELRAKPVDREMLELMKQAGCKRVAFGVETGNEQIRKNIGKGTSNEAIRETFALARELKLPTFPFLITGLPGETEETVRETVEFVRSLKPYYSATTVPAQVFPGSRLYEIMMERGLINDGYWLHRHPPNWGHFEVCANMPLFTVERNMVQLFNWCALHNQQIGMLGRCIDRAKIIANEEEFDRFDPWREDDVLPKLGDLLKRRLLGTLWGRARRFARPIRTGMNVMPTRLRGDQLLAFSMEVCVHRPANVYLFLTDTKHDSLISVVYTESGPSLISGFGQFVTSLPKGQDFHYTDKLNPASGFKTPGRYSLSMIVCGTGEPVHDMRNWLGWHRRTFVVE